MMLSTRLLIASALVLLTPLVTALHTRDVSNSTLGLPITKQFYFTNSTSILERDLARVHNLLARAGGNPGSVPRLPRGNGTAESTEAQGVNYLVTAHIGTPPTPYDLIVDTGSSNTWVGAGRTFVHTSSTRQTHDNVSVTYGSGNMSGIEFADALNLTGPWHIAGQSFGVAVTSEGFDGVDGVIGLGPVNLTAGTLSPDRSATIPTITDNLFFQAATSEDSVAMSFEPAEFSGLVNGELTFGITDPSKYIGELNYVPMTPVALSSDFFGIEACMRYGLSTMLFADGLGLIDTRTTLLLIPTEAFRIYTQATGAVYDNATTLYRLDDFQSANLSSLYFAINGALYEFTANAQIWPRSLNTVIGGNADAIYLTVGDIGTEAGSGLDFIFGMSFLERFYTIFNPGNRTVGIANTTFTTGVFN